MREKEINTFNYSTIRLHFGYLSSISNRKPNITKVLQQMEKDTTRGPFSDQ